MLAVLLKRYLNDLFETVGESKYVSRVIRIRKKQLLQVKTLKIEDSAADGEFNTSRRKIKNIDLCELPKETTATTNATKYDFSHVKYLGKKKKTF